MTVRRAGLRPGFFFAAILALVGGTEQVPIGALNSQELNKITFLNETGTPLSAIYFRPGDTDQWSPNILGQAAMPYGSIRAYFLHYYGTSVTGDFMGVDTRGAVYLVRSFLIGEGISNILEFSVRTLVQAQKSPPLVRVYLNNATNRIISYLFLAPELSAHWGFDLLSEASYLTPGASVMYSMPVQNAGTYFELFAITTDHARVQKRVRINNAEQDLFIDLTVDDLR